MKLQDCPVRTTLKVIGGKWKPVILYHLMEHSRRFGELRRLIPDATQKMLTQQLRELEVDGVVQRTVEDRAVLKVEYHLTPLGQSLKPVMFELCQWGKQHADKVTKNSA